MPVSETERFWRKDIMNELNVIKDNLDSNGNNWILAIDDLMRVSERGMTFVAVTQLIYKERRKEIRKRNKEDDDDDDNDDDNDDDCHVFYSILY
eukprot:Awhi_evm1s10453